MSEADLANRPSKWETAAAASILLLFFLINLLVATRTPTVFGDEVEYTDPAASLYFGQGFTSTMWAQDRHEFWCGNVPLYQGFLYLAFKTAGFGLLQARMTNNVLVAAGAFFIWVGLRLSRFVATSRGRLLALALVLSGSVSTATFRMVRYDAAMFFICALVFLGCNLPPRWRWRHLVIVFSAALLPFAGVPMLPYAVLLLTIHFAVYRFANITVLVSVAGGFGLGIAALVAFYKHFGVWSQFVEIVLPFTLAGHEEPRSLLIIVFGHSLGDENIFTSFFGNPFRFLDQKTLFDYSAFLLFCVTVLLASMNWRVAGKQYRKLIFFTLAVTLIVPPIMHVAGHYRSYYRWMTYMPLAVVVPGLLEAASQFNCEPAMRRLALGVVCFSLLLGVPLRTVVVFPDWSARSIAPLEKVAAKVVRSNDVVVCSFKVYFAVRPRAKLVFGYWLPARGEFGRIKDFPANDVTLVCGIPLAELKKIGGDWKRLSLPEDPDAAALARTRYATDFYRRVTK